MYRKQKNLLTNLYYLTVRYHFFTDSTCNDHEKLLVMVFDDKSYSGLVDRLKAVVSLYYIAKENNRGFKILMNDSFKLQSFIKPNLIDWRFDKTQMDYSLFQTKLLNYEGIGAVPILKERYSQYHVYNFVGNNIIRKIGYKDWDCQWTKLYNELFTPTESLQQLFSLIPFDDEKYIAVHIRFLNALHMAEPKQKQKPLGLTKQKCLIDACLKKARELEKEKGLPVLLFADDNSFLEFAKTQGFITVPGIVGHISYDDSNTVFGKAILDLYAISKAKYIYRFTNINFYKSQFPVYGALIGSKKCQDVSIN